MNEFSALPSDCLCAQKYSVSRPIYDYVYCYFLSGNRTGLRSMQMPSVAPSLYSISHMQRTVLCNSRHAYLVAIAWTLAHCAAWPSIGLIPFYCLVTDESLNIFLITEQLELRHVQSEKTESVLPSFSSVVPVWKCCFGFFALPRRIAIATIAFLVATRAVE